jgi:OpgC protein
MNLPTLRIAAPSGALAPAARAKAPALVESATRDPRIEMIRGALVLWLWVATFWALPMSQALRQGLSGLPGLAGLAGLEMTDAPRWLDGFWVMGLAVVAGSVFGATGRAHGLAHCAGALWRRARTCYAACLAITVAVGLMRWVPGLELAAVTQWIDPTTGLPAVTYPGAGERLSYQLFEWLTLRAGPAPATLLALCTVLLALAPLLAWGLLKGATGSVLAASLMLALATTLHPAGATNAGLSIGGLLFEQRYALLAWQLPFAVAFVLGWHRPRWAAWVARRRPLLAAMALAMCGAAVLAWQGLLTPLTTPLKPGLEALWLLALGLPLGLATHALLGMAWRCVGEVLGPLLLPLGQRALASWWLQLPALLLCLQCPPLSPWAAVLWGLGCLAAIWAVVRSPSGQRWLPF